MIKYEGNMLLPVSLAMIAWVVETLNIIQLEDCGLYTPFEENIFLAIQANNPFLEKTTKRVLSSTVAPSKSMWGF